jgi:hypothetical protein
VVGGQHDPQRFLKGLSRICQDLGHPGERLLLFRIENVKNDAYQKGKAGLFPMGSALERPFRVDQDVCDVLDIAHIRRALTDLKQRIIPSAS